MSASPSQLADLESNIEFAKDLMAEFKQESKDAGINALQALWVHHRIREWSLTFYGVEYIVSIPNMIVSGDIETACIALQNGVADDMSQPYHWLNSDRINFLVKSMKSYLGWD